MGFLGNIGSKISSFIGGIFGGASSSGGSSSSYRSDTKTTYEPDKVKVAEIEKDLKINLAQMEQEKIKLIREVKLDILENEYYLKSAYEQVKARGLTCMAQTILSMQTSLNEMAQNRLEIIEKGSLSLCKDVENFYSELSIKISEDNLDYQLNKLPTLLKTMESFEKGSDIYNIYNNMINEDIKSHLDIMNKQIDGVIYRQNQIINGILKSKEKIIIQTEQITSDLIKTLTQNYNDSLYLNNTIEKDNLLKETLSIEDNKEKLLLEGAK